MGENVNFQLYELILFEKAKPHFFSFNQRVKGLGEEIFQLLPSRNSSIGMFPDEAKFEPSIGNDVAIGANSGNPTCSKL
jgi:hypothetical protein